MKLSLVIPTYNEGETVEKLAHSVLREFNDNRIDGELIFIDDNSTDGTREILDALRKKNRRIRVIHRKGKFGLSSAVLDGWDVAKGDVLGVMGADLSHPSEKIKDLLDSIENEGADFAIGSRYAKGGKIIGRSFGRNVVSRVAALLARLFTKVHDPMTGFFMIRRDCIRDAKLDPNGFKIILEIIIKGNHKNVREVPIDFVDRSRGNGKSRVGWDEVFYYLQNLVGYAYYNKNLSGEILRFAFAGVIGTAINLTILYFLTEFFGIYYLISAVFSFVVAMTINFSINKVLTFRESLGLYIGRKYFQFVLISLIALSVNLTLLYIFTDVLGIYYVFSQLLAIALSTFINFFGNKIWTFSK